MQCHPGSYIPGADHRISKQFSSVDEVYLQDVYAQSSTEHESSSTTAMPIYHHVRPYTQRDRS